ncbi:MAG: SBBP repeat-containing protein [Syntrophobacteraceae bacterium]
MDYARGIALDSNGNAYIAGTTQSSDFPHDPLGSYHGDGDAWVAKLNATGTALLYAVFLGGGNYDEGFGIKVDSNGYAYVVGTTYSDDFPTKNALQGTRAGGGDAFVAKLNQAGNDLVYSTYLGGSLNDYGYALALGQNDNVHVTGGTSSSNFPTDNPLQSTLAGSSDVFVTRINQAGNDLVYSTYLGGSGYDVGYGITVDANGNAYVTGETGSTNFPHHFSQSLNGAKDAFVTKINTAGALVFSSFLGGSGDDTGWSISLYWGDCPLVAGATWSGDFPTLDPEKAYGGGSDAFVAVMQSDGASLWHSTYLGGSDYDRAFCVTQGADGGIYVTGETQSADFPLVSATQSQIYNGMAAFVTKIDDIGSSPRKGLVYSSFLGGAVGNGIEVNQAGNAFITGQAFGSFPTKNPLQASHQGDGDAFVTKLARHPSRLQGLVAFYPFNGNADDAGGGGRHASVYYATLAGGYEGEAYYFNGGTAYLEAPVDINPGRYLQLTIGAWAKPDSAAPRQVLLSHDDGGYDRTLCIDDRCGDSWSIFTGSGVLGVGGNLPVDTGQWTFLAASYTNPGCRLMASNDSASVACYTSGTPGTGFKTLYMGAHPWGMDYYHGRLDNVFVFNRWLTEEELDFIREAGAEGILSASRASADLGAIELLLLD